MTNVADIEKETKLVCPECKLAEEDLELEPIYECGGCGEVFSRSNSADGDSHRCPQCNKFGSKLTDEGCSDCNSELEEQETYTYNDQTYTDLDELVDAIIAQDKQLPSWLQEIEDNKKKAMEKREHQQQEVDDFRQTYPLWFEYMRDKGMGACPPVRVVTPCVAYKSKLLWEEPEPVTLPVGLEAGAYRLDFAKATVSLKTLEKIYTGVPLACLEMVVKPKYQIGQIIPRIDLSSAGCFNRQLFQKAVVESLALHHIEGDRFDWDYIVKGEDGTRHRMNEWSINIQSGQDPTKEWVTCPNGCKWVGDYLQHIHYNEACPKCSFTLK